MIKFHRIISYILVALAVLLAFFLFFEEKLHVPYYLEPLGRMHPLMLHLPIGLFAAVILLKFFEKEFTNEAYIKIYRVLTATTATAALLTAIFGIFLSTEPGYSSSDLAWHKWTGVAFAVITVILYVFNTSSKIEWSLLGLGAIGMFTAGHIGGEITHGENFLFEAFEKEKEVILTDSSLAYEAVVFPILEAKCVQCHNDQKTKGELNMSSIAKLMNGGKNGPLWLANDALNSHIIKRASLPINDKKHMPPKSKPQLTDAEIQLISRWIDLGANVDKTIGAYKSEEQFYTMLLGSSTDVKKDVKVYPFSQASKDEIEEVNTPFCTVNPVAYGSPALEAKFYVSKRFELATLKNLQKVKEQVVSINLAKMPFNDEDLELLLEFKNLENLNLNATNITGNGLAQLAQLKNLKTLSISNTKLSEKFNSELAELNNLEELFAWNVNLNDDTKNTLKQKLKLVTGFNASAEPPLILNVPTLVNKETILDDETFIELEHVLPDVKIRYTLDGTEPDSVSGKIYNKPFKINGYTKLRAIATKEGWYTSKILETEFYKVTHQPEQVELLTAPNAQYEANFEKSLVDKTKGSIDNFKDNNWLGYQENPFSALFTFKEATEFKNITLSYLAADDGYIMPPTKVQFYAGNSPQNLKLIATQYPPKLTQPQSRRSLGVNANMPNQKYKYVKIVADVINPLPKWHPGAGSPGWVFIDEVFFN